MDSESLWQEDMESKKNFKIRVGANPFRGQISESRGDNTFAK